MTKNREGMGIDQLITILKNKLTEYEKEISYYAELAKDNSIEEKLSKNLLTEIKMSYILNIIKIIRS